MVRNFKLIITGWSDAILLYRNRRPVEDFKPCMQMIITITFRLIFPKRISKSQEMNNYEAVHFLLPFKTRPKQPMHLIKNNSTAMGVTEKAAL